MYHPPSPLEHRFELGNGMIVYVQEDHYLPTLELSARIRTGSLYDPADKVGLASMTGSAIVAIFCGSGSLLGLCTSIVSPCVVSTW